MRRQWVTRSSPESGEFGVVVAELGPAIHVFAAVPASRTLAPMRGGWVYIMTNRPNGTLYTGVTTDIARHAYDHWEGHYKGFTKRYALTRLVCYELHEDINAAIQRRAT